MRELPTARKSSVARPFQIESEKKAVDETKSELESRESTK